MSSGPSILHRFGGHGGSSTEWEIRAIRDDDPFVAELIQKLPKGFKRVQHSGQEHYSGHTNWIMLPEGVPSRIAGAIVAALAAGEAEELKRLLYKVDKNG